MTGSEQEWVITALPAYSLSSTLDETPGTPTPEALSSAFSLQDFDWKNTRQHLDSTLRNPDWPELGATIQTPGWDWTVYNQSDDYLELAGMPTDTQNGASVTQVARTVIAEANAFDPEGVEEGHYRVVGLLCDAIRAEDGPRIGLVGGATTVMRGNDGSPAAVVLISSVTDNPLNTLYHEAVHRAQLTGRVNTNEIQPYTTPTADWIDRRYRFEERYAESDATVLIAERAAHVVGEAVAGWEGFIPGIHLHNFPGQDERLTALADEGSLAESLAHGELFTREPDPEAAAAWAQALGIAATPEQGMLSVDQRLGFGLADLTPAFRLADTLASGVIDDPRRDPDTGWYHPTAVADAVEVAAGLGPWSLPLLDQFQPGERERLEAVLASHASRPVVAGLPLLYGRVFDLARGLDRAGAGVGEWLRGPGAHARLSSFTRDVEALLERAPIAASQRARLADRMAPAAAAADLAGVLGLAAMAGGPVDPAAAMLGDAPRQKISALVLDAVSQGPLDEHARLEQTRELARQVESLAPDWWEYHRNRVVNAQPPSAYKMAAQRGGISPDLLPASDEEVLIGAISARLLADGFSTRAELRDFAVATLDRRHLMSAGTVAEGISMKAVEEAAEVALVAAGRVVVARYKADPGKAFDQLVALSKRLPMLTSRTSDSIRLNAYSTPLPLAYLASRLARVAEIGPDDRVGEPTAGHAALLLEVPPGQGAINEIDEGRRRRLGHLGFKPDGVDALRDTPFEPRSLARLLVNPPFGTEAPTRSEAPSFPIPAADGLPYASRVRDHVIALRSLEALRSDGTAVLILRHPGAPTGLGAIGSVEDRYAEKSQRAFWHALYSQYNVTRHITVAGEVYQAQGAGWPVDIVVIEGRGASGLPLPMAQAPDRFETLADLRGLLSGQENRHDAHSADSPPLANGNDGIPDQELATAPALPPDHGLAGASRGTDDRAAASRAHGADLDDERTSQAEPGLDSGSDRGKSDGQGKGGWFQPNRTAWIAGGVGDPASPVSRTGGQSEESADIGSAGVARPAGSGRAVQDESAVSDRRNDEIKATGRDDPYHGGLAAGSPQALKDGERESPVAISASPSQVPYVPMSSGPRIGMVMPGSLAQPMQRAQERLKVLGDIDEYARRTLGFDSKEALWKAASAEQIDTWALAHLARRNGGAFINGKQTGGGKGRDAALDYREARTAGRPFVYSTEGAHLYRDFLRDLADVGVPGVNALVTNGDLRGAQAIQLDDGRELATPKQHDELLAEIARTGKLPDGFDLLLTTYTQQQTVAGRDTLRRNAIAALAPNAHVHLSESHEAAGTGEIKRRALGDQPDRAEFARSLVKRAKSIGFDSATYAKRANVLDLYGRTTLGRVPGGLQAIAEGGVPLQQAAAALLAEGGEYIRLERSFAGIPFRTRNVKVDVELANQLSQCMAAIAAFDQVKGVAVERVEKRYRAAANQIGTDSALDASSINFTALMHNVVAQGLLAIKADATAERAISLLQRDRINKPLLEAIQAAGERSRSPEEWRGILTAAAASAEVAETLPPDQIEAMKGENEPAWMENYRLALDWLDSRAAQRDQSRLHGDNAQGLISSEDMLTYLGSWKPVVALANTMGTFLDAFVDENELKSGDAVTADFRDLLLRYLDRCRDVVVGNPYGEKTRHRLSAAELGPEALSRWETARDLILNSDLGRLPISPIDWIEHRLSQSGLQLGEATGRDYRISYTGRDDDGRPTGMLDRRGAGERSKAGVVATTNGFNDGQIDALVMNESGATGLSLHSSRTFIDQRPRAMLIAQADLNIVTFIQLLGRINRTGQRFPPYYEQLPSDLACERRPMAVTEMQMAMVNAQTTAARKGAFSNTAVDFMNQVGDQVVANLVAEEETLNRRLGYPLRPSADGFGYEAEGAARKVTGRISLLTPVEQTAIYDRIERAYADELARLNAIGRNPLEQTTLPLEAKPSDYALLYGARRADAQPLEGPAWLVRVSARRLGEPMTGAEVAEVVAGALGTEGAASMADLRAAQAEWIKGQVEQITDRVGEQDILARTRNSDPAKADKVTRAVQARGARLMGAMKLFPPGQPVQLTLPGEPALSGVVTGFDIKSGPAGDTTLPGRWVVSVALADAMREIKLPLSQVRLPGDGDRGRDALVDLAPDLETSVGQEAYGRFDAVQSLTTEDRYVAVGNLIGAYVRLRELGETPAVIAFSGNDGITRPGLLLRRGFDRDQALSRERTPFQSAEQVTAFLTEDLTARRSVTAVDDSLRISLARDGGITVRVDQSRASGGRYYLDPAILQAAGRGFVSSGKSMVLPGLRDERADNVIAALLARGARLVAETDRLAAQRIMGIRTVAIHPVGSWEEFSRRSGEKPTPEPAYALASALLDPLRNSAPFVADRVESFNSPDLATVALLVRELPMVMSSMADLGGRDVGQSLQAQILARLEEHAPVFALTPASRLDGIGQTLLAMMGVTDSGQGSDNSGAINGSPLKAPRLQHAVPLSLTARTRLAAAGEPLQRPMAAIGPLRQTLELIRDHTETGSWVPASISQAGNPPIKRVAFG